VEGDSETLFHLASVRDCGVVGVPDDKWGERVVAVVRLHPDSTADEAELITAVKTRIGSVKAPKQVLIWPARPSGRSSRPPSRTSCAQPDR
jgi:fatty-acyl-CoA synthase